MFGKLLLLASGANAFLMKSTSDPVCRNGVRSIPVAPGDITVCCPAYCGRCNDYDTCKKVNGQASENACCASKVTALACENNSQDPHCLKKCTDKSAPCSLGVIAKFTAPKETTASEDCGKAASTYHNKSEDTVKAAEAATATSAGATPPASGSKKGQWPKVMKVVEKIQAKKKAAAKAVVAKAKNLKAGAKKAAKKAAKKVAKAAGKIKGAAKKLFKRRR